MPPAPSPPVTAETIVDDLMRANTAVIPVFLRHRMMCVGCPVGRLHDVAEACREHGVAVDAFLAEIRRAIAAGDEPAAADPQAARHTEPLPPR